jgi:flagellar hook-length control protein FliK
LLVKGLDLMTSTFESQAAQPDKKVGDGMLKTEMDGPSLVGKKREAAHKSEDRENQIRLDAEVKTGEHSRGTEEKSISQNQEMKTGSAGKEPAVLPLSGDQKTPDPIQQDVGKEAVSPNQTISRTDSESQVKASESTSRTSQVQPGAMDQIVEKATLMLKNGKHEMMVELKPEVMGRLKMELSLEHHHLNVKIMAESPAVRDMIQQNLPQLRTELQNQGLDVDRMDVHTQNEKDLSAGNREMNGSNGDSSRTPMDSSNDSNAQTATTEEAGSLEASEIQHSNGRISYFA